VSGRHPAAPRLLGALAQGPIALDSAIGTRLIARGLDLRADDPCLWNLDRPEAVLELHRLDVRAGSVAVLTNTFGANRSWLARIGRAREVAAINRRGVELARLASGDGRFVLGSIGPTAFAESDPGPLAEQAEALVAAGVDGVVLETFELPSAEAALTRLRDLPVPRLAGLHTWPGPTGDAARRLEAAGASAIGANCVVGMARALAVARRLRSATALPILIKPSAGLPGAEPESPAAFAAAVSELLALGVRLIGGCCGTTEAHVEAIAAALTRARSSLVAPGEFARLDAPVVAEVAGRPEAAGASGQGLGADEDGVGIGDA